MTFAISDFILLLSGIIVISLMVTGWFLIHSFKKLDMVPAMEQRISDMSQKFELLSKDLQKVFNSSLIYNEQIKTIFRMIEHQDQKILKLESEVDLLKEKVLLQTR